MLVRESADRDCAFRRLQADAACRDMLARETSWPSPVGQLTRAERNPHMGSNAWE